MEIQVEHDENYMKREEQLLQDQGATVFRQIFDMMNSGYGPGSGGDKPLLQFGRGAGPKSVAEYLSEHARKQQEDESLGRSAKQALDSAAPLKDPNDVDSLLEQLQEESDVSDDESKPIKPKRLPGCFQAPTTTPAAKKARATNKQDSNSASKKAPAARSTASTTAPTLTAGHASSTTGVDAKSESKAATASASGNKKLDTEMQLVYDKHMATDGTGANCLFGFVPANFLVESEKRYVQSGKLRGVP